MERPYGIAAQVRNSVPKNSPMNASEAHVIRDGSPMTIALRMKTGPVERAELWGAYPMADS